MSWSKMQDWVACQQLPIFLWLLSFLFEITNPFPLHPLQVCHGGWWITWNSLWSVIMVRLVPLPISIPPQVFYLFLTFLFYNFTILSLQSYISPLLPPLYFTHLISNILLVFSADVNRMINSEKDKSGKYDKWNEWRRGERQKSKIGKR